MSEQSNKTVTNELDLLKARADQMGISYKGNIGVDTLKAKIEEKLSGKVSNEDTDESQEAEKVVRKTQAQLEQETRDRLYKEKMKLVRCRISNLNPAKNDLRGEIIVVANRFLGTVRKFIPFGEQTENGYHIPQCIYEDLKARKFQQVRTKKVKGQIVHETRMVPEYAIEVLPPLSEEELHQLRDQQAAAQRLAGSEE